MTNSWRILNVRLYWLLPWDLVIWSFQTASVGRKSQKCRPKLFSISAVKYKPAFQKNSKYILQYHFQSAWVMNKMGFFHSVACFCLFRVLFFYFFWTWMFLRWVPWRRAMSPSRRTECLFFSFPSQSVTTQQNTGREWTYRLAGVFNSWEKESVLRSHAARSSFPNIEKYLCYFRCRWPS